MKNQSLTIFLTSSDVVNIKGLELTGAEIEDAIRDSYILKKIQNETVGDDLWNGLQ